MTVDSTTGGLHATGTHTDDHVTQLLAPVRSGDLRKVSARCTCGWRSVAIAATKDDAEASARRQSDGHLEAEAAKPVVPAPPTWVSSRHSALLVRLLVAAAVAALVLVAGLELLWGTVSGVGVDLVNR